MNYHELFNLIEVEFIGLTEPDVNELRLSFSRCKVSEIPEKLVVGEKDFGDCFPIEIDNTLPVLQIDFKSYIAYAVTNESFTTWDEYEEFQGKAFRIYNKSRYLDFIGEHTFASKDYPGEFKHYGIVCLNHIINIVSVDIPIVSEL